MNEKDLRAQHVAEFVNRLAVAYRKHSALAVEEDMVLAVREFGVDPSAFYDEPSEQERLRTAAFPPDSTSEEETRRG